MKEQHTHLDIGKEKIRDLDADDHQNYIVFTLENKVITNDHPPVKISTLFQFPLIRRIDQDTFLIADARTSAPSVKNAFIYNFSGELIISFCAGDAIQAILIHRKKIIVSYFDEGVFSGILPSADGLAIFDLAGNQEFGINSNAGNVLISDCYCMCKYSANSILFYAYSDFIITELNLDTFKLKHLSSSDDFTGASGISSVGGQVILHSCYKDPRSFFYWNTDKKEVTKFGDHAPGLIGLKDGKFLKIGDNGYSIVDPLSDLDLIL